MPRGNPQNLKSINERTTEEAQEIRSRAGKASGKARRDKKNLRIALEALLEKLQDDPEGGKRKTGAQLITAKLFQRALEGDVRAFETLRDTVGQAPVQKVMLAEVDAEVIAEVESAVYEDEAEFDDTEGSN